MVLLQAQEGVVMHDNHGLFWKAEWFVPWNVAETPLSPRRKQPRELGFITVTATDLWQGHLEKVNLKT